MKTAYNFCPALTDEVSTGQLQNWVAEIISNPKVGASIGAHESKVEIDSAEITEVAQA
jgi:hypothetical protein